MRVQLPFANREEAGRSLAQQLAEYAGRSDALILALVRGGVVIGRAIADALHLPLFPYVVRKIGHPLHREYALGAIAEGGSIFLDRDAMAMSGMTRQDIEPVIEEEMMELQRRKGAYAIHPLPALQEKTVILTDDGAATGSTMLAAMEDMRKAHAEKIIVALPVCPPETARTLRSKSDILVALATPSPFNAVGEWYRDFPQVEDEEVVSMLSRTAQRSNDG
ncbi:phosphoribosyltransferase [Candidatus Peregrinibacteria bacterium]|nr:phosphoribosyltransferase [Candidatus Peregrinibacteria bacterium]